MVVGKPSRRIYLPLNRLMMFLLALDVPHNSFEGLVELLLKLFFRSFIVDLIFQEDLVGEPMIFC